MDGLTSYGCVTSMYVSLLSMSHFFMGVSLLMDISLLCMGSCTNALRVNDEHLSVLKLGYSPACKLKIWQYPFDVGYSCYTALKAHWKLKHSLDP